MFCDTLAKCVRTDGRTHGRTDGRTDGRNAGRPRGPYRTPANLESFFQGVRCASGDLRTANLDFNVSFIKIIKLSYGSNGTLKKVATIRSPLPWVAWLKIWIARALASLFSDANELTASRT